MTREELLSMAYEAGYPEYCIMDTIDSKYLEKFGALIAAAEREQCALIAESYEPRCDTCPSGVANAIRARGEEK